MNISEVYMVFKVREAQLKMSELLRRALEGEEVFIRKGDIYFSVKKTDVTIKEAE